MSEEISMSEEVYAKPDLTKKVRLQTSADRNSDVTGDDARIYDNYFPDEGPSTKSQEDTTDQQQTSSVNVSSGKKSLLRATAAFVVLAIILLAILIVLVVLLIADQERNQLKVNVARLVSERNELQTNYSDLTSISYNLTELTSLLEDEKELLEGRNNNLTMERDQLQTDYNEVKNLSQSLTQANVQLLNENGRLTTERDELKAQMEARCPTSWIKFENSCYLISRKWQKWTDSRKICEDHGANLLIISNVMEQTFISSLNLRVWIGLTDEETEDNWKWVNGETATTTYWLNKQPDNHGSGEDCAEIDSSATPIKNWNDRSCNDFLAFICEKALQ